MSGNHKILLDTDIGTDIDDALALSYLLLEPDCDILGITTVTGEAEKRARLASMMCCIAGQPDIPILPGSDRCLIRGQREVRVAQAGALELWPHATAFRHGEAVEFMRSTIRAHPGEVTLLGIAPPTNIALLFLVDPEIPSLLRGYYQMNGRFSSYPSKWSGDLNSAFDPQGFDRSALANALEMNAIIDPHATSVVFAARPSVHRSVGIDVTRHLTVSPEEFLAAAQHEILAPVRHMARAWFDGASEVTFHDPLAAVSVFDGDVCHYGRGIADVELASEKLQGYTYWSDDLQGPHEVAKTVDVAHFFSRFWSVFAS